MTIEVELEKIRIKRRMANTVMLFVTFFVLTIGLLSRDIMLIVAGFLFLIFYMIKD